MTDQTISNEDKAAAEKQDAETRRLVQIQLDEQQKRDRAEEDRRLSSMSNEEFIKYTRDRYGF